MVKIYEEKGKDMKDKRNYTSCTCSNTKLWRKYKYSKK